MKNTWYAKCHDVLPSHGKSQYNVFRIVVSGLCDSRALVGIAKIRYHAIHIQNASKLGKNDSPWLSNSLEANI